MPNSPDDISVVKEDEVDTFSGKDRQERERRPALVFLRGELLAVPIPLDRKEVTLGRALEADVRVSDSRASRLHSRITTEPGGPVEPGTSWSAALQLFVESLKPVAEHAEAEGVLLLIEPEPGLLIEKADQFLEFLQHIDSPAIGLNFDIGHAYCVGDDPGTTIPRLAPYIRHFHLEDIASTRVHHHLIPGDGAIDFAATFRAIQAIGYQGWITIELYPYVDDPDSAARLARERVVAILNQD